MRLYFGVGEFRKFGELYNEHDGTEQQRRTGMYSLMLLHVRQLLE